MRISLKARLRLLRRRARRLRRDVAALFFAARDPRVAWPAKAVAAFVAAYALSPIDLIPDFIPLVGQLDELLILPLGIMLAVRLIDPAILAEHRISAGRWLERPTSRIAAFVIVAIWAAVLAALAWTAALAVRPA